MDKWVEPRKMHKIQGSIVPKIAFFARVAPDLSRELQSQNPEPSVGFVYIRGGSRATGWKRQKTRKTGGFAMTGTANHSPEQLAALANVFKKKFAIRGFFHSFRCA